MAPAEAGALAALALALMAVDARAEDCAPGVADLRDPIRTRASRSRWRTRRGAGARPDVPREPAAVRRHALRLRDAAAGGVLDAEHADPARHAVLRCGGPPDAHARQRSRRGTRRRSRAGRTCASSWRSTAGWRPSSASSPAPSCAIRRSSPGPGRPGPARSCDALLPASRAFSLPSGPERARASGVGAWRSLVARRFWVPQVAGSNPVAPTRRAAVHSGDMGDRLFLRHG